MILALTTIASAQVTQEWVARFNGAGNSTDYGRAVGYDGSGNVYTTGYSYSGSQYDIVTIKYNSAGAQQWVQTYNGTYNSTEYPYAIAVSSAGDVYIAGYGYNASGGLDMLTLKYNTSGALQWAQYYNGPYNSSDYAYDLTIDGSGNAYTAGYAYGSSGNADMCVVKYNSAGTFQWVGLYNGPYNSSDYAYSVAVDGSGNVYMGGYSYQSSTNYYDYTVVKYNSSGTQQWVGTWNDVNNYYDYGRDVAVDGSGNVYLTGYAYYYSTSYVCGVTVKWNSAGTFQWAVPHQGTGGSSYSYYSYYLKCTTAGDVYVAGHGYDNNGGTYSYDLEAFKLNTSGAQQWYYHYNGPYGSTDYMTSPGNLLALDASGNAYILAYYSYYDASARYYDLTTIKINGSTGAQMWVMYYDNGLGASYPYDYGYWVNVDASNNVYVCGFGYGLNSGTYSYDWTTVKYNQTVVLPPDLGVVNITAPPDTVYTGISYAPACTIQNYGTTAQTAFPINARITSPGYPDYTNQQIFGQTVLLNETFEGTFPPPGWTIINGGGGTATWTKASSFSYHSGNGTNQAYLLVYGGSDSWYDEYLVSPPITLTGTSAQLQFYNYLYYYYYGQEYGELLIGNSPTGPWTTIVQWTGSESGVDEVINLTPYIGGTKYLAWHYWCSSSGYCWDWSFDNVLIKAATGASLAAGAKAQVIFDPWKTQRRAGLTYTNVDSTALVADGVKTNDFKTKTIYAKGDIAVIDGSEPVDEVYVNGTYNPTAKMKNMTPGYTEAFTVTCQILDEGGGIVFTSSRTDSLGPSEEKGVPFEDWTVGPDVGITYEIQVICALTGDFDPSNDKFTWYVTSVLPPGIDVGTVSIDEPTDRVDQGHAVKPKATVKNFGESPANFDVYCEIPGYTTNSKSVVSLAKDSTIQVTFDDWTPTTAGAVLITVYTKLTGDGDVTNDTAKVTVTVVGVTEDHKLPTAYNLEAARPNPVATWTDFKYALPDRTQVVLAVYDITGKRVKTLVAGFEDAGYKSIRWNGRDNAGKLVPNGLYFVRLETPKYLATRKLVLTR
jgi:uncharacterized delta-60 repeat protein